MAASFDELAASIDGGIGLALVPIGNAGEVQTLGGWKSGPAWSTSKVPLAIAALREQPSVSSVMESAITESDNASAERLWESLGGPTVAKAKVEAVLRDTGDQTSVQSQRVRPEFTAFGQTVWSLANQARFLSNVACDGSADPVLDLMGQIESSQAWGLGRIPGARFKGGWGPSESGPYLVRQFGVISTRNGSVAVAIAAEPASGSFDAGIQEVNMIAEWIESHINELPAGSC